MAEVETALLPTGSVVLDSVGVAWQRSFNGTWSSTLGKSLAPRYLVEHYGPLRLLHDAGARHREEVS